MWKIGNGTRVKKEEMEKYTNIERDNQICNGNFLLQLSGSIETQLSIYIYTSIYL